MVSIGYSNLNMSVKLYVDTLDGIEKKTMTWNTTTLFVCILLGPGIGLLQCK